MGLIFNVNDVPKDDSYAPITPGTYDVQMDAVEEKQTLAGGESWSLKMKIVSDNFKGRTFFLNYNVSNANEKTQQIARRDVAEIAKLVGAGDDISIESIKSNKVFTILLEQRINPTDSSKIFYNAKQWKIKENSTAQLAQASITTANKKPWAK